MDNQPQVMNWKVCKQCYWWHEIGCVNHGECEGPIKEPKKLTQYKKQKEMADE